MGDNVLKDYGWCKLIQRDNKYVISYDGGGVAVQMLDLEINREQLEIAMLSQYKAEKLIIFLLENTLKQL